MTRCIAACGGVVLVIAAIPFMALGVISAVVVGGVRSGWEIAYDLVDWVDRNL
jgi:hypothetical protein